MRVGFVVEKRSGFRRIYCYINGVMSGVVQYPADDDFSQVIPADITIGSNQCTMDLYCIRVYDNDLTSKQMEDNWIADTQDGGLRRGTLDICLGRRESERFGREKWIGIGATHRLLVTLILRQL